VIKKIRYYERIVKMIQATRERWRSSNYNVLC